MTATDHTCLACGKIHPGARDVTLRDGTVVSSYSEAWRHETEVLNILAMETKTDRRHQIGLVRKHRGDAAADQLTDTLKQLWDKRVAKQRATG